MLDRQIATRTLHCTNSLSLLMRKNHADRLGESDETRISPRWPSEKALRDGKKTIVDLIQAEYRPSFVFVSLRSG